MSPGESDLIPRIVVRDAKDRETIIQALALHIGDLCDIATQAHMHNRHGMCEATGPLILEALELLDELDPDENEPITKAAKLAIATTAAYV